MRDNAISIDNLIKQLNGAELTEFLKGELDKLVEEGVIKSYDSRVNFTHKGFTYAHQYLANFVITTLDDKFIVVNNSNSYRQDRYKIDAYNLLGITKNANISPDIIASILLFPDAELANTSFQTFRSKVINKEAFSPASHLFVVSEFVDFLHQHKAEVEEEIEEEKLENESEVKDGSYFGKTGNKFEKEIVSIINDTENQKKFIKTSTSDNALFDYVIGKICIDYAISHGDIDEVNATDTIPKLRSGGNAKTDVLIRIKTFDQTYSATFSAKRTTQKQVSCHDYRSSDFVRVLGCEGTKLEFYLNAFQKAGSKKQLIEELPEGFSVDEFTELLACDSIRFSEWAISGMHDEQNLIDPETQISQYLIINKDGKLTVKSISEYIDYIFANTSLTFSVPFQWTYPSKRQGERIQLKLPIREF